MADLWLSLLPIAIAMAVTPGRLIAMILLFHTERTLLTPLSYVAGMATNMLIEGAAFALLFSLTGAFAGPPSEGMPPVLAILYIVIGILLLVGGAKFALASEDEDKAPPKWLDQIESFTPSRSFSLGLSWLFISPKQWVFTLTAVAVIFAANLDPVISLLNYLLFILIVLSLFLLLILIYIVLPKRSSALMDSLFTWLKVHGRTVMIVVFLIFGLVFLVTGIDGLRG